MSIGLTMLCTSHRLITKWIVLLCLLYTFHHLVLEVYQFARDAAVADSWLMAQEPYLISKEYGVFYSLFVGK